MQKLSEEKININYVRWIERLQKYDAYSEEMINDIGESLKNSSFSITSSGGAYKGSMIDITLNMICVLAVHMNENGFGNSHPLLKVNTKSLIKVLLIQHISKAIIFTEEKEQWKINKGSLYTFNENLDTVMKCGERTIYMCMKYGIKLSEEEYEAIRIIDKDDDKSINFSNPLSIIVKIINQLVTVELRRKWLDDNKDKTNVEK